MNAKKIDWIHDAMINGATSFGNALTQFYPAVKNNGFHEQNCVYYACKSLNEKNADSNVFQQLPFENKKQDRTDNHFDGLVINKGSAVFLEAKRLYSLGKAREVIADMARLNRLHIGNVLENDTAKSFSYSISSPAIWKKISLVKPKKVYAIMLAESWDDRFSDWWMNIRNPSDKWNSLKLNRIDWQYFTSNVIDYTINGTIWNVKWLCAYREIVTN